MTSKSQQMGMGIALGAGLGAALGVIAGQIALWLAIGVAIGIAIGAASRRRQPECIQCAEIHEDHKPKVQELRS